MNNKKSPKAIIITTCTMAVIILIITVVAIILTNNYNSTYSSILELNVQPSDAIVIIDDESVDASSGIVRVTPGDHSIAIIRAGFFPEGEEFSIKEGEVRDFDYALSPYTEEAKKLAEEFEY